MRNNKTYGHDFWCAFNVIHKDAFIPYDEMANDDEGGEDGSRVDDALIYEVYLKNDVLNPEQQFMLKEAFDMLSDESRDAISIVTFWPDSLIKHIGPESTRGAPEMRKQKVLRFLKSKGYEINKITIEVKAFLKVYFSVKA